MSFEEFQDVGHQNGTILAILNLYVAPMPPIYTQGNPISGYRRLRDFGGKQMMSSSDSVCTYPLLMIKKVLLEDKQRNLFSQLNGLIYENGISI